MHTKKLSPFLILLTLIIPKIAVSQDSSWSPKLKFELSGIHLYHSLFSGRVLNTGTIPSVGPAIPYGRSPFLYNEREFASDAPLYHGAESIDLRGDIAVLPAFHLVADIIAEHRGSSYGVYSTKNIIVYPRATFTLDTAISLWSNRFDFHLVVGNFTNVRIMQGLQMYNVDGQGGIGSLGWKSLHLNYYHLGDMFEGIGLNTNDAVDYTISLNNLPITTNLNATFEGGFFTYDNFWHKQTWMYERVSDSVTLFLPIPVPFTMSNNGLSAAINLRVDSLSIYSEYRYRFPLLRAYDAQTKSALVVGVNDVWNSKLFRLTGCAEFRFYGRLFNDNYINQDVRYRGESSRQYSDGYGASIGPYLYPLTQFLRPFGQWAVFTEFQGRDVLGYTLQADAKYFLFDRFGVTADIDLNVIKPAELSTVIYPFYTAGIMWEPLKKTGLYLQLTNREMNLDKHYPTLYLLKYPAAQFQLRYNFDQSRY